LFHFSISLPLAVAQLQLNSNVGDNGILHFQYPTYSVAFGSREYIGGMTEVV